nr:cytochrome P450 CYP72A219-like [Quercus suber]
MTTLSCMILNWVWLRPKYLERCLRKQGLVGNSYRLFFSGTRRIIGDFQKPKPNPLVRLLAMGVVNYEGEKWAKYRNIINPAFHIEKLKVMYYISYLFKPMWNQ